jgi:hypothetical protein
MTQDRTWRDVDVQFVLHMLHSGLMRVNNKQSGNV